MIEITEKNDVAIVRFKKRVTSVNIEVFRSESLSEMISQKTDRIKIVLNLGNIEFLDSSGLGRIIGVHKMLAEKKGTLIIAEMGKDISNLFHMVGLHKMLQTFDTEKEAIEKFSS